MRRPLLFIIAFVAALTASGCGKKEISSIDRRQAATMVSEANFAMSVRDWSRAEGLFAQAVKLCPDTPEYWLALGTARRRLNDKPGAQTGYEETLKLVKQTYKKSPNPALGLQQVYLYALLGKVDDARSTVTKVQADFPNDPAVRAFVENKQLDQILTAPEFKDLAL